MERIQVELGMRSYPILIGAGLLENSSVWLDSLTKRPLLVITNEVVAPLYLRRFSEQLVQAGCKLEHLILPDGESTKNLSSFDQIMHHALQLNLGRDCVFVALGGGVIGDLSGFAAACYQRGVSFVQVPTTLLAQVDSSVGGKTAVNHPLGKNMVGAFHQPALVLADTDTLKTLPDREFAAGIAEVIKYGIIWDADFFSWLEQNQGELLRRDANALTYAIRRCCEIKAEVVAEDETERGVRALLNLGHTFGHAIETEMGYGEWLHGEAVAAGTVLAAELAKELGWLQQQDVDRIANLLKAFELPIEFPAEMGFDAFVKHMRRDKKSVSGQIRLVLPTCIGEAQLVSSVTDEQLRSLIEGA